MTDVLPQCDSRRRVLRELLLEYLEIAHHPTWPGSEGTTVEEVLRTYSFAAAAGLVPTREQLLRAHVDLADEVAAFFT